MTFLSINTCNLHAYSIRLCALIYHSIISIKPKLSNILKVVFKANIKRTKLIVLIARGSYSNIIVFYNVVMGEVIQFGEITSIKVNDESKSAEFTFDAVAGTGPLGPRVLKPTKDSEDAYNAMVALAVLGLQVGAPGGQHTHVRYDDSGPEKNELDDISIHRP